MTVAQLKKLIFLEFVRILSEIEVSNLIRVPAITGIKLFFLFSQNQNGDSKHVQPST